MNLLTKEQIEELIAVLQKGFGHPQIDTLVYNKICALEDMALAYLETLAQVPSAWRPISTAPKDGSVFLAGCWVTCKRPNLPNVDEWQQFLGHIDDEGDFVDPETGEGFGWEWNDYTHWQPLPAPPAATGKEV